MSLEPGAARCLRMPFTPMAWLTVINECLAEASFHFAGVVRSSQPSQASCRRLRAAARRAHAACAVQDLFTINRIVDFFAIDGVNSRDALQGTPGNPEVREARRTVARGLTDRHLRAFVEAACDREHPQADSEKFTSSVFARTTKLTSS
jgi:hypothetical protein